MAQTAPTGPLQRKLKKAIEPQADSPEVLDALRELSVFYGDNSVHARRGLRSSIEQRGLTINRRLLTAFEGLQGQLDAVDSEVESLCAACGSIASRLQDARASTEVLLAQTARLRTDAALNEQRSTLASAFTRTFGLTPEQEAVLNAPADAVTQVEPLLSALRRVQQAHEKAQGLLDGPHQALALQVISTMAAHEERAYAAIYRWVQNHCAQLQAERGAVGVRVSPNPNANPNPNPNPNQAERAESVARLRRGVASLKQRPTLLSYCVSEVAFARTPSSVPPATSLGVCASPFNLPPPPPSSPTLHTHAHTRTHARTHTYTPPPPQEPDPEADSHSENNRGLCLSLLTPA